MSRQSLWNHSERSERYGPPSSRYCKEQTSLLGNRSPFVAMTPVVKEHWTKEDIVGFSDDETPKKLKPINTRLNAAMIGRIANQPRLPPAPTQAISEIPVIPVSNLDSSTRQEKGFM